MLPSPVLTGAPAVEMVRERSRRSSKEGLTRIPEGIKVPEAAPASAPAPAAPQLLVPAADAIVGAATTHEEIVCWKMPLSTAIITGMAFGVVGLFSDVLGAGDNIFKQLSVDSWYSYMSVAGAICTAIFLYVFDVSYWDGELGRYLALLGYVAVASFVGIGAMLSARSYPAYPLAMFILLIPATAFVLRRTLFRRVHITSVLQLMAFNFCFAAAFVLSVWLVWLFSGDNQWTTANQAGEEHTHHAPHAPRTARTTHRTHHAPHAPRTARATHQISHTHASN